MADVVTRRRVKLYTLSGDDWNDEGTGHIDYQSLMDDKMVSVLSETEGEEPLLQKLVLDCEGFQRQQDTLIVWKSADGENNLALSFQEEAGCQDAWEVICTHKGFDPSLDQEPGDDDGSEDSEDRSLLDERYDDQDERDEDFERLCRLLPAEHGNLDANQELVTDAVARRKDAQLKTDRDLRDRCKRRCERIAEQACENDFLGKTIEMFRDLEDLEDADGLANVFRLVQGLVLLGESSLYELMFTDDKMVDIIGALEYDPDLPDGVQKPNYREYLKSTAVFTEAVAIGNAEVVAQIHQTYKIQYLKDVILQNAQDDIALHTLRTYVMFNGTEIVERLQAGGEFTKSLLDKLKVGPSLEGHKDFVGQLKAFCGLGKTLMNMGAKVALLKALIHHGAFLIVGKWLCGDVAQLARDGLEIIRAFSLHVDLVRAAILAQHRQGERSLLHDLVHCFANTNNRGLVVQSHELISRLLATEEMDVTQSLSKTKILSHFYDDCMDKFMGGLEVAEMPTVDEIAGHERMNYMLNFLKDNLFKHGYHIKNYLIAKGFFGKVIPVLQCRQTVLVLSAIRVLRAMIGLPQSQNEFYNRQMIKYGVFQAVIDELERNGAHNSLLQSCILELLEHVRKENIKSMLTHIAETHHAALSKMDWAATPKQFLEKHAMNNEVTDVLSESETRNAGDGGSSGGVAAELRASMRAGLSNRFQREAEVDENEEDYFGSTDADADADADASEADQPTAVAVDEDPQILNPPPFRKRPLVDYDDDEDDDDEGNGGVFQNARKKTSPSVMKAGISFSFTLKSASTDDVAADAEE